MTTATATIIWILLSLIAGLSGLLLYAVHAVSRGIRQQLAEQKLTNRLLRELGEDLTGSNHRPHDMPR
ncbi:Na+/phosphate symporter [Methylohalomonas lacus]|uniref:Na+/phosphate symporter n=1 Tax=Methylohalomonas lacus TaxID=398773 RepID=A0AAE3L5M9_9GAMM|nr:hypothetical protein [Methylohalomonas lacus]MCS3903597.1 Na+/phosphate symporter [Methylohalomonas lacus]